MIVIGCDPGLHTGISVVQVGDAVPPEMLLQETADYTNPHSPSVGARMGRLADQLSHSFPWDDVHLVVERFIPEARKVDTTALEVIGELRRAIRDRDRWVEHVTKWHWQTRQEKDSVSGDTLRRLGLWLKGKEQRHVMDAARHTVVRLVKMNHRPTIEKGWPNE